MLGFLVATWMTVQDAQSQPQIPMVAEDICEAPPIVEEAGYLLFRDTQRPFVLKTDSIQLDSSTTGSQPEGSHGLRPIRCTVQVEIDGRTQSAEFILWTFPKGAVIVKSARLI